MELNLIEKVIALEGVDVLGRLDPEHVASIAMIASEAQYPSGSVILEETRPVDALYVILDGSVEVTHQGRRIDEAKRGAFLGLWALLDENDPVALTAKSIEDTHLLRIGRNEFYDLLSDDNELIWAVFSEVVRRARKVAGI
jgi:CRP-like cAMP-binding protein